MYSSSTPTFKPKRMRKSVVCSHCARVLSVTSKQSHLSRKDHRGINVTFRVVDSSSEVSPPSPPPYQEPVYVGPTFSNSATNLLNSLDYWQNWFHSYNYNTTVPTSRSNGILPQQVPSPGPPASPQIVNLPDSTQDKDVNTSVKGSPVRSPSANSVTSSPSADATIKVRLAGSEDFFEVELPDIGDTYTSIVKCFAEELDVEVEKVSKIRKLPNILIRKDRDVKRIKSGSEFEVELAQDK